MAEVEYSVAAVLQLSGDADAERRLGRVATAADRTRDRLKMISVGAAQGLGSLGSMVGGAIDQMARLGAGAAIAGAAIGGAFAFNEVKTGLVEVNSHLENATIGFATLFHTLGGASMQEGFGTARDLIGQIRDDAKSLPGEFGDFVSMAQTITAPLLNTGKGVREIRDLTRDTVVAASSLGIRYDQASREMAMLLEGHAGAHNILGLRLGITTHTKVAGKDFNEANTSERFEFLTKKLGPAKDALGAFASSWEGLTSTLADSRKQFLGNVTEPLFGRMKLGMVDLLHYLDLHKGGIDNLSRNIGVELANAYGRVEMRARQLPETLDHMHDRWVSIRGQVEGVAHTLDHGVRGAMHALGPLARFLGHELEHPSRLLKEIIGLRIAAGLATGAPGALNAGFSIAKLLGSGGGGAAGAAGAAELGGAAAAAGPALIVAAAALVAVGSAAVAVSDNAYGATQTWIGVKGEFEQSMSTLGGTFEDLARQGGLLRTAIDLTGAVVLKTAENNLATFNVMLGTARDVLNWINNDLEKFIKVGLGFSDEARLKVDVVAEGIDALGVAAAAALGPVSGLTAAFRWLKGHGILTPDQFMGGPEERVEKWTDSPSTVSIVGSQTASVGPEKPSVKAAPIVDARGSKFEVKIDARDQDPDRIIRRMFTRIGEVAVGGTLGAAALGVGGKQ